MNFKNVILTVFVGLFTYFSCFAQNWKNTYQPSNVFIENKGQFDYLDIPADIGEVSYVFDQGSTKVFFGTKGVHFNFLNAEKKSRDEREAILAQEVRSVEEHKQKERLVGKFLYQFDQVNMHWVNSNSSTFITGQEEQKDYHSYAVQSANGETSNFNKVKGYKKITYHNVYEGIDVQYEIHPEIGFKYALIVQPGADVNKFKMRYDKDVRLEGGTIKIPSEFGDILDHAPITFYANNEDKIIDSKFTLENNTVSFKLGDYDQSKEIIVDPWTQTPTYNTDWNCVWECDYDLDGNVYIIGGIMPMKLQKFDPNGALQWTYNTPFDTNSNWLGGFATNGDGVSFVTNGTTYGIQRIETDGSLAWSNLGGGALGESDEYWNVEFNCDESILIVGGTDGVGVNLRGAVFEIDVNNGNAINTRVVAVGSTVAIPPQLPTIQEVRSLSASPSSKYYWLSHDTIGMINDNFDLCDNLSENLFKIDSDINFGYKCENYRYNNTGIMGIRADDNFVYVNKADQIQKRDLNTLQVLAQATIPNGDLINTTIPIIGDLGNQAANSGIDIDDCGNIFVGSRNQVHQFDSDLNLIQTFTTDFNVYDVRVTPNGKVIAAGSTGTSSSNARNGYIQQFDVGACAPLALICCDANFCKPANPFCPSDAPIELTVSTEGGTWSGNGISADGVFDPSIAGPGEHTITYSLECGEESYTFIVEPCLTIEVCQDENGNFVASGGSGGYTWFEGDESQVSVPITNEQECIDCPDAEPQYIPFFNIYDGCSQSNCTITQFDWTNVGSGTSFSTISVPFKVEDEAGNEIIITDLNQIIECDETLCPDLVLSLEEKSDVSCNGDTDGSATVEASGGEPTYSYVWTPGGLTGPQQSSLAPGTYNVTVTDSEDCTASISVSIAEPAPIVVSTSFTSPSCGLEDGSATASVSSGGTAPFEYEWSPGGQSTAVINNIGSGPYTVTVKDANDCEAEATVNVISENAPEITLENQEDASCFNTSDGSATVSVSGGSGNSSFQWSPSGGSGLTANNLAPGNYTFTATDEQDCSSSITVTIGAPTPITVSGTTTPSSCDVNDGSVSVTASGGAGNYSYAWQPNVGSGSTVSGLEPGNYIVTVTDGNNCEVSEVFTVILGDSVIVNVMPSSTTINAGESVTLVATTIPQSSSNSYSWSPPTGLSCTDCPNPVASPSVTTVYTVTVTNDQNCTGQAQALVSIQEICKDPFVPNIFSPNGDGNNDFLCVKGECIANMDLLIFNRWGQVVFESGTQEDCWDGTFKGKPQNAGVFVYKLRARLTNGEDFLESGNVTLVR